MDIRPRNKEDKYIEVEGQEYEIYTNHSSIFSSRRKFDDGDFEGYTKDIKIAVYSAIKSYGQEMWEKIVKEEYYDKKYIGQSLGEYLYENGFNISQRIIESSKIYEKIANEGKRK